MKRTLALAAICVVWVIGTPAPAAEGEAPAAVPGLDQAVNEFWGRWEKSKPSEAIRRAGPNATYPQIWDEIGRRCDDIQSRSNGGCLGHSLIARKSLGDNMQYVAYFALYDPAPIRVQLLYYRAKDTWAVISLEADTNSVRWLHEAGQSVMPTPPQTNEP